jgi:hypothetical protein
MANKEASRKDAQRFVSSLGGAGLEWVRVRVRVRVRVSVWVKVITMFRVRVRVIGTG